MFCDVMSGVFFFFKQKTAYELRISDWSSDVCSSDLLPWRGRRTDLRDCAMTKTDSKSIATLLLAAVDLRERLAFGMFRVDNPQASKTDFDASDRSRYFAYADSAMGDLLEGSN